MRRFYRCMAVVALCISCGSVLAQERALSVRERTSMPANEARIALVIGNAAYSDAPLKNPANDANDIAAALRNLGFVVAIKTDAKRTEMKQLLREFSAKIKNGGVGLVYYAGHGVQSSNGRNYLIPVDADVESEAELEDESVDLNLVLRYMEEAGNRVNILILDACRNNPYARSFRSASRGLAQVDAPSGTWIAYATAPGSVASDGVGRNGLYTQYLLDSLKDSDSEIERVFKRVRKGVFQATGGKQIPWESSSLIGDFAFNAKSSATPRAQESQPAFNPMAFELAFWNEIKDRKNPDEYRAYLEQYPNGQFSKLARARLTELTQPAAPREIQDPARVLLGSWSGAYKYDTTRKPGVPFKMTIVSVNDSRFDGLISEPATFGNGSSRFLFAKLTGSVDGSRVRFVKTYDGTGGVSHSVNYQGVLDTETGQVNGGWSIGSPSGRTTGSFALKRD